MHSCDFEMDDVKVWPGHKRSRAVLQEREKSGGQGDPVLKCIID